MKDLAQIQTKPWQSRRASGITLVELVIAFSLMAVVTAVIVPVLVSARLNLDASSNNAEALQNGRILLDHLRRHLSAAAGIERVSGSSESLGYIEFTASDDSSYRYDVSDAGYVAYGQVDSQSQLAGPVTQLQFTCYDGNDMSSPITDVNEIRLIKIETTVTNGSEDCPDKEFMTSAYIYADPPVSASTSDGWWCLDDGSGTTALDSSGNDYHGTLMNMDGDEWTTGIIDGALQFDGSNDYVDLPIDVLVENATDCTVAMWVNWLDVDDNWQHIFDFGSSTTYHMYLVAGDDDEYLRFAITDSGWSNEERIETTTSLGGGWHHIAVTIDDVNEIHTLYLDGVVIGQNTNAGTNPSDLGEATDNWLGRPQWGDSEYFDGMMDDVRFYSRALSADEVDALFSSVDLVKFEAFEEAKLVSNGRSLTISTPAPGSSTIPVSTLGSLSTGLTHTAPTGSNRLLIVTAHAEDWDDEPKLDAITYGGQAMTLVKSEKKESVGIFAYVVAYMLDEEGIAAASGATFSPSWDKTPQYAEFSSIFLENVNQSDPIGDDEKKNTTKSSTLSTNTLQNSEGDMAILAGTAGNTGTYSVNNGFTEASEISITSADGVVGYFSTDGSDVTPSVTHSYPYNRQVLIGFVVQVAPAPITTIEGDLLIAAVAADGEETISEPPGEDWTLLSHGTGDRKVTFGVWAKLASASESTSHRFTWGSDEQAYGWIMRFTGHDPSNPIDVIASNSERDDDTPPSPSVTTTVNNAMILRLGGFDEDDVTVDDTGLPGHTTITMDMSDSDKEAASGGAGYMYQMEAGSCGSVNFDLVRKEQSRTVTLAISPLP